MFGRIVLVGFLGVAIAAAVVWATGLLPVIAQDGSQSQTDVVAKAPAPAKKQVTTEKQPIGGNLYALAKPVLQPDPPPTAQKTGPATDPIVIPRAHLALVRKQDVPAQRDGVLMFVGIAIRPGENPPKEDRFIVRDGNVTKEFRRLKEGDRVEAGELLAQVDDTLARADMGIKRAKLEAANADRTTSEKTRDEAYQRWLTQQKLWGSGGGTRGGLVATSEEELRGAQLTYVRYRYEVQSKEQAIIVAKEELAQANKTDEMYEIHAKIPGIVKTLYKHEGESVKNLEPVVQLQNYDLLRAEGLVDAQYGHSLHKGMQVVLEPTQRENAVQLFSGHRMEINGVAVSKDPQNPLIVSASEDGTAMVWDRNSKRPRQVFYHPSGIGVRCVACTPPGSELDVCLTGGSDGIARIWDLNGQSEKPVRELKGQHRGAIRCVAFSPDGKTCATGGDDNEILISDTATGDLRYHISGHRNFVTAIHFTPQSQLVSASRDNTVRVWRLGEGGAEPVGALLKRKAHEVDQLGVSPDGKLVLDEQGREMRLLSLPGLVSEGILENTSQTSLFRTFAQFSPDGRLVATTSSADGVVQLWRLGDTRSYEIRQFMPRERSAATCVAFAPNGTFLVGGIKDRKVYVWPMPSKSEVEHQLTATVTNVEEILESVDGKIRIMAEFNNPTDRSLMPGDEVTIVAYPQAK
jgi:WD40 repeat protein